MHPQDKSGDDLRPFWHHEPLRRNSFEQEQAHLLDEILEEWPGTMTFDEARIRRVRDRGHWGEADSFEIAVRALFASGLIRHEGDLLIPVRPVRQMAALGFTIG